MPFGYPLGFHSAIVGCPPLGYGRAIVAKKAIKKAKPKAVAKATPSDFDLGTLSKGFIRKLNALKKSLGDEIAHSAFAQWLRSQPTQGGSSDKHAAMIVDVLSQDVIDGKIKIPRGGFIVRRGRGRVIVEAASKE